MIDTFDILAFIVFGVLLVAGVVVVVTLGSLPGRIAQQRGYPQLAAIAVAGWLGVATLGLLWPLAFLWAFFKPPWAVHAGVENQAVPGDQLLHMQSRLAALEIALQKLEAGKEGRP